jgi:predicted HicB family RNase H-like nuclease
MHPNISEVATSKAKLMIYLDPEYKKELEKLAEKDGRSMSNFVERLIMAAVDDAKQSGGL